MARRYVRAEILNRMILTFPKSPRFGFICSLDDCDKVELRDRQKTKAIQKAQKHLAEVHNMWDTIRTKKFATNNVRLNSRPDQLRR